MKNKQGLKGLLHKICLYFEDGLYQWSDSPVSRTPQSRDFVVF